MKILHTADGERIVMDDDTAAFLLGPQGEALLRRKAEADDRAAHFREDEERAALAAECAFELRAREREDDEETLAEIRLHARIEQRRERARELE
jgi:hypothetical protein